VEQRHGQAYLSAWRGWGSERLVKHVTDIMKKHPGVFQASKCGHRAMRCSQSLQLIASYTIYHVQMC